MKKFLVAGFAHRSLGEGGLRVACCVLHVAGFMLQVGTVAPLHL